LVVMPDAFMVVHRAPIISGAARNKVPGVYWQPLAKDGGLLSYGLAPPLMSIASCAARSGRSYLPEELARREERLAKLAEARAKLEARVKERFEREMAEHRAKLAARDEKTAASGKKPGGSPPAPPLEGPQPKDQINLTDEDSRIMPVAGGGFEQGYNAQAGVGARSLLGIATDVVQAPNDKQQIAPMLEKVDALPEQFGRPETLLADNGYFSEANVMACAAANIEPLIATGRQPHHPSWRERFAAPPPAPEN